jgi:hypothetical protein
MSARRTRPRATDEVAVEQAVELTVVARQAGVRIALARRYLAFGLFDPCEGTGEAPLFAPTCSARLAKAERLRGPARGLGLISIRRDAGCRRTRRCARLRRDGSWS